MGESAAARTADVTMIKPPNMLQSRVSVAGKGKIDFDAVKRAEEALQKLSSHFDSWMTEEIERLVTRRDEYLADTSSQDALTHLFHVTHDIKGQAPTLGYSFVADIAGSLCKLLELVELEHLPAVLVSQHVDAIRALVAEVGRDDANKTAKELCRRLTLVTQDFLEQQKTKGLLKR